MKRRRHNIAFNTQHQYSTQHKVETRLKRTIYDNDPINIRDSNKEDGTENVNTIETGLFLEISQ